MMNEIKDQIDKIQLLKVQDFKIEKHLQEIKYNLIGSRDRIFYYKKKTYHYIILLDDSISMQGFTEAQKGLLQFLDLIEKTKNTKVTIIIFNSDARCVVDFQIPNAESQKNLIVCNGGGTSFEKAFQLAYQKIVAIQDFDQFTKHFILFYTDGEDSFPTKALEQFAQLPAEKKAKLELIACCLDKKSKRMIEIVEYFQKNCAFAILQDAMQPSEIGEAWQKQFLPYMEEAFE
ncbi:unnamed protein product [Paramecium sonneborni]|uniref:VWFA domain-containing protein n=1 Tax=Paramecium sonneborni TaxID=65129 RepID=A0A8S1RAE6_9CILI|nr:unnamed protein product [Paramecium sonneborni]